MKLNHTYSKSLTFFFKLKLFNFESLSSFIFHCRKHKMELELQSAFSIEERQKEQFPMWFKRHVSKY
jgi:hypothetical protein